MLDHVTTRHALPLIVTGQAQKEITHNEALTLLDMLVNARVEAMGVDVPPTGAQPGQCWIVGPAPVGEWVGQAQSIAGWTSSGWRFVAPTTGMHVLHAPSGEDATWANGEWQRGLVNATRVLIAGEQVLSSRTGPVTVRPAVRPSMQKRVSASA